MEPTLVLSKTDAARMLLSQRDAELARTLRSFLIMVDGRRTLAQLRPMMDALGVTLEAIRQLAEQGLLHLHHDAAPARSARAPVQAQKEKSPVESESAPVPEAPRAPAQAGNRSMAAAKFYALNLVTLMLVGQDEGPRRAVREATTPQQLADWLTMCLDLVRDTAGPERAQVFADKIWAVLPDEVRELLDQDWDKASA